MCSVCPRCHPPHDKWEPGASFGPFSPILPAPVEKVEGDAPSPRLFEFPVGGLICSCQPEVEE